MYAIIATGGKQYRVSEGDVIRVEKLKAAEGESVTFEDVLAIGDDKLTVGNPTIEKASVAAKVLKQGRAKKVIVYKYKNKSGYHKKNGHRQAYTEVQIDKINA
ncbi:MAG: 50S ribosomal protein L21 [Lachnospiraceae bacterium]|nr:50S ribosomal protein L21 [Lachnospiraceae bacterium]